MYVGPDISTQLTDAILRLKPKRVIFNPGSENSALEERLRLQPSDLAGFVLDPAAPVQGNQRLKADRHLLLEPDAILLHNPRDQLAGVTVESALGHAVGRKAPPRRRARDATASAADAFGIRGSISTMCGR